MKHLKLLGIVLGLMALVMVPAHAQSKYGTKEEAKALVERAVAAVKENPEAAFAKFNDPNGGFKDRDLYIFVVDSKGITRAHGGKPILVGKSAAEMKDANGFPFIQALVDLKEPGWVNYKWPDANDGNKVKDKQSYGVKVGDYTVGCGYYVTP